MLGFALLLGTSIGCAWHVVPIVAADKVAEKLTSMAAKRGFELQLGAVYVEPTERIVLDGVVLHDRERRDMPPVFKAARLEVTYELHGVTAPKVHLHKIVIHSPRVHVQRNKDGKTNLDSGLTLRTAATAGGTAGGGGLRKYLSAHIPQLIVRDMAIALDDNKGAPIVTPVGIDARHLRLKNASLIIKNTSPVRDIARFDVKGATQIDGFNESLQIAGQLNWPERAGWGRVELPGDFALEVAGFRAAVRRITAHTTGKVQLGGVKIERLPAEDSPFALDVRQITIVLSERAAAISTVPKTLTKRLPNAAIALLRHIAEVTVESPVIVGRRPVSKAVKAAKAKAGSLLMPRKTARKDRGGKTSGAKTRDLARIRRARRAHKRRTAKQRAMGKPPANTEGEKVRAALIELANKATNRLERRLKSLRKAAAAIPVRKIRIHNGRARYRDERLDSKAASEMSDFSAEVDRADDGIVSLKLLFGVPGDDGAENAISGRVHTATGDSQVSVRLDRLPIAPYAAVMPSALTLHHDSAVKDTQMTLRFDARARKIALDGQGTVERIDIDASAVSRHRIEDLGFKAKGKLQLDLKNDRLAIDSGRIDLDRVQVLFDGSITEFRTAPVFDMAARIPTVHCQDVVDGIVPRFAPVLNGMRCSGSMAFRLAFALKTKNMRSLKFEFVPTLHNLKIGRVGKHIDFAVLEGPFEHNARQPDGTLYTFVTGPGSERWVPIEEMSEHLVKVVTTTEDGLFFYHKGFSLRQIRGAMVANLRKGRFVRGASTISQQTAKNLFFVEREKTISRKLQEAVVTWEMEHRLTKQQILELYFNIIEFGPRIYGIKAAANHYFNRAPGQLTLLQAIWLGSIIPGPRKFYHQFVRGNSGERWREYLCWIGRVMHKRERITAQQLARLGTCNVVFGGGSDGSEEPDDGGDFGLGHEGDPSIGDDSAPTVAGEGDAAGAQGINKVRQLKRKQAAPSVSEEDQP
jgi:hypothetical protein